MTAASPLDCPSNRYAISVLAHLSPKAKADLIGRLVDLVIRLAPDADSEPADYDMLPAGMLRAERDGFVQVWRRRPQAALMAQARA